MRNRTLSLLAAALLAGTIAAGTAFAAEEITAVRYTIVKDIKAPPAKVWSHLTAGKSFMTWCPYWKSEENQTVTLAKVGDSVDYTDSWGSGGRSIVTFIVEEKELRIAHEPNDGSYLCQAKVMLAPTAAGTKVTIVEAYTDESNPEDRKATAVKSSGEMEAALGALAALCEKS